jgi:hypothetical protein
VLSGAKVIERILVDNLTETAAYKHEYEKLREYIFAGNRDQLWNVIPASIQTPMKEVRSRLNRAYRLQNIGSRLQQNLTKAVLSGAKVIERILVDNLTETAAYKLEYDKLREYVFAGKRDQLWNVIPASIQTPRRRNVSAAPDSALPSPASSHA